MVVRTQTSWSAEGGGPSRVHLMARLLSAPRASCVTNSITVPGQVRRPHLSASCRRSGDCRRRAPWQRSSSGRSCTAASSRCGLAGISLRRPGGISRTRATASPGHIAHESYNWLMHAPADSGDLIAQTRRELDGLLDASWQCSPVEASCAEQHSQSDCRRRPIPIGPRRTKPRVFRRTVSVKPD